MLKLKFLVYLLVVLPIINTLTLSQTNNSGKILFGTRQLFLRENLQNLDSLDLFLKNSLFLLGEPTNNQRTDFVRLDSIMPISNYAYKSKDIFKYNSNEKITEGLEQFYFDNNWENLFKNSYTYNDNNKIISDILLDWNQSKWDSLVRIDYYYNSKGFLSRDILKEYISNGWINKRKTTNEYDSSNNLINMTEKSWVNNKWLNLYSIIEFYSTKNKKDSILFMTWNADKWKNFLKSTFYYNNESKTSLDSIVGKKWASVAWKNAIKRVYTLYDENNNSIEQVDKHWNAGSWENDSKSLYSYNEYNLIKGAVSKIWDGSNWVSGIGVLYFNYDDFFVGFITNGYTVHYSVITDVKNSNTANMQSLKLYQNYPNPFNPSTVIRYEIPKNSFVAIKVYNVLGKEVASLVNKFEPEGFHEINFNANNLSSGIYMYRISVTNETENFSIVKKMILAK